MSRISSYPFISSYTFLEKCEWCLVLSNDTKYTKEISGIDPNKVKNGDRIYVVTELIDYFFKEIDTKISCRYHLITGRSDILINHSYSKYLNDKILSWSSSNLTNSTDIRFKQIPLGIQNLNWSYDDNPQSDINLIKEIKSEKIDKENKVLLSFQIHTNSTERNRCYDYFKNKNYVKERKYNNSDRRNREFVSEYFREIRKSKFVVCPWGNGIDCHRNYEVWYLNSIPIIRKHKALEMLYDLPALWIDDWIDLDTIDLEDKYKEIIESKVNEEKLNFDYWWRKIK